MIRLVCLFLAAAILPAAAAAADQRGATIFMHGSAEGAAPCAACHGLQGEGRPGLAPALAGMPETYLEDRLAAFAANGKSPIMQIIASHLNAAERTAVATYIAGLSKPSP
jgi:cytochrome c553